MDFFVGQTSEFSKTVTETDVYNFAGICGDFNSVHINRVAAQKTIFGQRIVPGALVVSFISTILGTKLPGDGTIYLKQESKFIKPVYFDDTVTARVKILSIDSRRRAVLSTEVFNQNDECVITGEAKVVLPLEEK